MPPCPPDRVLIIGGGEFGLSAAAALAESSYRGCEYLITVLDPSATPPSMTAASSDLNKIVRSDYSDVMYSSLAKEALSEWRTDKWNDYYVESGIIVLAGAKTPSADYVKKSFKLNKESNPEAVHELVDAQSIKEKLPSDRVKTGTFEDRFAYFNGGCGYARARGAMDSLCAKVRAMGVTFTVGKATSFQYQDDEITGVHLEGSDGRLTVAYDFYIVAAGSWTAQLLPEFIQDLVSSGQVVGTIQLTPEEADEYRSAPVLFSMDSGFYVFPPTLDNVVKFAIHGAGYYNPGVASNGQSMISTPRTKDTPAHSNDNIPLEAIHLLKQELAKVYPDLATRQWKESRLCWYTDTTSSNFLIDYHPKYRSLFLATGGSGHAFKFLPIMATLIKGSLERTLPVDQANAWSYNGLRLKKGDASRGGLGMAKAKLLVEQDMARDSHL